MFHRTPVMSPATAILLSVAAIAALLPPAPAANAQPLASKAPKTMDLDLSERPFKGGEDAPLLLIEFSDYQCPYCGRHVQQTYPRIDENFVANGKVRYYFADMPLENIHPLAFKAAEAARCAGEQGEFWAMHDRLFAHQRALEPWSGHAEALGLDVEAFEGCLESGRHAAAIRADMAAAQAAGITGTPSTVVAVEEGGRLKVLGTVIGAQAFPAFQAEITRHLVTLARENRGSRESATQ